MHYCHHCHNTFSTSFIRHRAIYHQTHATVNDHIPGDFGLQKLMLPRSVDDRFHCTRTNCPYSTKDPKKIRDHYEEHTGKGFQQNNSIKENINTIYNSSTYSTSSSIKDKSSSSSSSGTLTRDIEHELENSQALLREKDLQIEYLQYKVQELNRKMETMKSFLDEKDQEIVNLKATKKEVFTNNNNNNIKREERLKEQSMYLNGDSIPLPSITLQITDKEFLNLF